MNRCNTDCYNPCDPANKKSLYSSQMIYDGRSMEALCIKNGMPLNMVIENIGRAFDNLYKKSGVVWVDEFEGTSDVFLSQVPSEVLIVTYGGFEVPSEYYKVVNKQLVFSTEFCHDATFGVGRVIYTGDYRNEFSNVCK